MNKEERKRKCTKETLCCCEECDRNNNCEKCSDFSNRYEETSKSVQIKFGELPTVRYHLNDLRAEQELFSLLEEKKDDVVSIVFVTKDGRLKKVDFQENLLRVDCLESKQIQVLIKGSLSNPTIVRRKKVITDTLNRKNINVRKKSDK